MIPALTYLFGITPFKDSAQQGRAIMPPADSMPASWAELPASWTELGRPAHGGGRADELGRAAELGKVGQSRVG